MKKGLVSVFLFLIAAMAFGQNNTGRVIIPEANLKFEAINDFTEVVITGGIKSWDSKFTGKVLEVPSKIQGYPVTSIKNFGYVGSDNRGLWIPDCVKSIGRYAFQSSRFPSIRLPNGLTTIEVGTFSESYVKSVVIPVSVKEINAASFMNCDIESISIPAGCTIYSSGLFFSAFEGCNNLKTIIFPAGTVYLSGTGIFSHCNNLERVVMPKGFVPVYISKSDFKDYNLLNYIQGDKIKKNFKFEDSLRNTKVRNAVVVYHEAYLDAYNKAMAAKDWEKAKSVVDEFSKKISSDSSLSSLKSKWDDMLFDIDCTIYLPAYVEMLEQKGSFEKIDSRLKFKIPLDNDL